MISEGEALLITLPVTCKRRNITLISASVYGFVLNLLCSKRWQEISDNKHTKFLSLYVAFKSQVQDENSAHN